MSDQKTQEVKKQFVCLSGLPRTGSTLFSAILGQNPQIHAEGNSAVCQIMWDIFESCNTKAKEQLLANNRQQTVNDLVSNVRNIYYKNVNKPIIVDKCRSWTMETKVQMLKLFVDSQIKMIVLERPITEIIQSLTKLHQRNNIPFDAKKMFLPMSEPIMRSIAGLQAAKKRSQEADNNNFLFISYDDLTSRPKETIEKVYAFCGWQPFEHDFENIVVKHPENDNVYNLKDLHTVRPKLEKVINHIQLSSEIQNYCDIVDKLMGYKTTQNKGK